MTPELNKKIGFGLSPAKFRNLDPRMNVLQRAALGVGALPEAGSRS